VVAWFPLSKHARLIGQGNRASKAAESTELLVRLPSKEGRMSKVINGHLIEYRPAEAKSFLILANY
jgi:hypothetical protein